ncbi:MAG: peptidase [Gammaproteobacteria bacterium]|nr:peptidase [Gammaproteobacteria bacterium]
MSGSTTLPYGSWPSPLNAADMTLATVGLHEVRSLGDHLYWLESRPSEGGRSVLMCRDREGEVHELTPAPFNVRTRVHEYGGGAYLPVADGAYFVNFADQRLYHAQDGNVRPITAEGGPRFADLAWDAARTRLLAVTEAHDAEPEPKNCLQAIDVETGRLSVLHDGHDFYASPRISADGTRMAFVHWDHPNMPWDGCQLEVCDITSTGELTGTTIVAGGADESVLQPEWVGDALIFISDRNGYWNLYRLDESGLFCVLEDGVDYGSPPWAFAMRHYAQLDDRYLIAARKGPEPQVVLVDSVAGFATPLDLGANVCGVSDLVNHAGKLCCLAHFHDELPALVSFEPATGQLARLRESGPPPVAESHVSTPEHVTFPTRDGAHAFAYVYWPSNPDVVAPADELPPLLVMTHGGPTGAAGASLNLRAQYYTSRGWAVADVNYRGSSGYGRAYRDALNGNWGILDVQDCEDLVRHLGENGQVDAERVAIRGGSAGGYTTLAALTSTHSFRAGASHYGIGDLNALARDTHKFESRYLDGLLGSADALEARSPIHHIDRLSCPVIFFQGSEDKVVPPNQSHAMVDALRQKGIAVAYLEFAGEGHGFRMADNIVRAVESEYGFFCRVFGIHTETAPELEIDNL